MIINIDEAILEEKIESNLQLGKKIHQLMNVGSNPEAYAFIITGLKMIYNKNFTENELKDIITDGDGDEKIDAFYINNNFIDIFDFKKTSKCPKTELDSFKGSLIDNIFNIPADYSIFNENLRKKIKKIHNKKFDNYKKRIFVVRFGNEINNPNFYKFEKSFRKYSSIEEIYFLNKPGLISRILESENYLPEWNVEVSSREDVFVSNENELFLKLPLVNFLKLNSECVDSGFDLFEKNVRYFLKNKNLSSEIINTLEEEPDKFYIYHNGITLVVDEKIYSINDIKYTIKHPQVINGAQTINSIYQKYKTDINNKKLKKAKIICKIIYADEKLSTKLCETTNTQLSINYSDLKSNDDFQIKLKNYIENVSAGKFKYIRKRGEVYRGKRIKIIMPSFMQWAYSCLFKNPSKAKNKKKYLFDSISKEGLYKKLVEALNSRDAKLIENICNIGIYVQKKIKKERNKEKRRFLRYAELHIISGLFNIKNKNTEEKDYKKIIDILEKHQKNVQTIDPGKSLNDIFTKTEDAWDYLFKKIKN